MRDLADVAPPTPLTVRAANAARNARFRPADAAIPAADVARTGGQI